MRFSKGFDSSRLKYPPEEIEPWETNLEIFRKSRKPRKPTLASARKQAEKAGLNVIGATMTVDGVKLEFGQSGQNGTMVPFSDTASEWDTLQ